MEIENEGDTHFIPEEIKWAIIFKKKEGLGDREAARTVTGSYGRVISHQTVKNVWENYQATNSVFNNWSDQGRPKKLDQETLDLLEQSCIENRIISVKERKETLKIDASTSTVNRPLNEMGYKAYRARKKPVLTEANIEKRLQFAEEHQHWTVEDWMQTVFSDESAFHVVNSNGRTWVRLTEEEVWTEHAFQPYAGQSDGVMVWGAISSTGVGPLIRFEDGSVDAVAYLGAFRYRLRRYYPELYGGSMIFQQDNAPIHTAKITKNWFLSKEIECIGWPPQSPDLNIIENVWGIIKYNLRSQVFSNVEDLWFEVQKMWNDIPPELIQSLYESMPRRIEAVIQAKGGNTKY